MYMPKDMYILTGTHKNMNLPISGIEGHYPIASPNDKFLDWSKLKAFADDKINLTLSQTTIFRPFQTERVCRRQF